MEFPLFKIVSQFHLFLGLQVAACPTDLCHRGVVLLCLRCSFMHSNRGGGRCPLHPPRPLSHHLYPLPLVLLADGVGDAGTGATKVQVREVRYSLDIRFFILDFFFC